jgi:hypothetical protein
MDVSSVATRSSASKPTNGGDAFDRLCKIVEQQAQHLIDLFKAWDANHDGRVSRTEFQRAMASLSFDAPKATIDALFNYMDKDKSGYIEYKELHTLLHHARTSRISVEVQTDLGELDLEAMERTRDEWKAKALAAEEDSKKARATLETAERVASATARRIEEQLGQAQRAEAEAKDHAKDRKRAGC